MIPAHPLKTAAIFTLMGALLLSAPDNARAQTAEAKTNEAPSCEFSSSIESLKTIQLQEETASGTEVEALLTKELEARASLLRGVIACALYETEKLRDTTENRPVFGEEGKSLQSRFVLGLEESAAYYRESSDQIVSSTLPEIKILSAEVKLWREKTYLPLAEKTSYFILWTQNQELVDKARTRLSQARQTISTLKLTNVDPIQNALNTARTFLLRSEEAHNRAEQSLTRNESPEISLGHIKTSLGELYRVYESFFGLSEAVRKALAK